MSGERRSGEARPGKAAPPAADATGALKRRFSENLIALRAQVDLSQEETAQRAGLHRSEIHLLERGLRLPQLDTIVKLGGAVEAEPCELLARMAWRSAADVGRPGGGGFEVDGDPA